MTLVGMLDSRCGQSLKYYWLGRAMNDASVPVYAGLYRVSGIGRR